MRGTERRVATNLLNTVCANTNHPSIYYNTMENYYNSGALRKDEWETFLKRCIDEYLKKDA